MWTDGAAWTREILMGSGRGTTKRKSRAVERGWCDPRGLQGALHKGDPGRGWAPKREPRSVEHERLPPLCLDATQLLAEKVEGWGENTCQSPAFPFQGQKD